LEDKTHTFAVHYRAAKPATVRRVLERLRKCLRRAAPEFRIVRGDKVWEIVPPEVEDKGAAIRTLLSGVASPALVMYAGDTPADEGAFAALKRAVTIHVGRPRRTHARFWLRDPAELGTLLERLAEARL
jgi:trehalose-phosphatase